MVLEYAGVKRTGAAITAVAPVSCCGPPCAKTLVVATPTDDSIRERTPTMLKTENDLELRLLNILFLLIDIYDFDRKQTKHFVEFLGWHSEIHLIPFYRHTTGEK
jgi:hypothetical protein